MTMPIGALKKGVAGMSDPLNASGLFYQWGRKDPLGRPGSIGGAQVFDVLGSDQSTSLNIGDSQHNISGGNLNDCMIWFANSSGAEGENVLLNDWNNSSKSNTLSRFMLEYAISHPWMYIMCDGQYKNWTVNDDWLWGNGYPHKTYPLMEETYKSIFDPSPEGFRVAPQDLWLSFVSTRMNSSTKSEFNLVSSTFSNGYTFYCGGWQSGATDYYFASGYRLRSTGRMSNVGSEGFWWASSPVGNNAAHFFFNAYSVFPLDSSNRSRGGGFPVRCVQEP